jgi:hypothetical protein
MTALLRYARIFIVASLAVTDCTATTGPAEAHGTLGTATATADAALDACTGTGKALYNCVAGVLDDMGKEIASFPMDEKQTVNVLRSAATRLRAAVNKVQALSAISLCQSAIAGALRQARNVSVNNSLFGGWGTPLGLASVAKTLAKAAAIIQARG